MDPRESLQKTLEENQYLKRELDKQKRELDKQRKEIDAQKRELENQRKEIDNGKISSELNLLLEKLKRLVGLGSTSSPQNRGNLVNENINNDLFERPAVVDKGQFINRMLNELFFESSIRIGNFIDRIELWKKAASSITRHYKYRSEKDCYSELLDSLKIVDGRWFASESPHGGLHECLGENEYPDFLFETDAPIFDFQIKKLDEEECKIVRHEFDKSCNCKRCSNDPFTFYEKLMHYTSKRKLEECDRSACKVGSQFQTILEVKPPDSHPWDLRPRDFFFVEQEFTSASLKDAVFQVIGRAARRICAGSQIHNCEELFDKASKLFPWLVAVCSPFHIIFLFVTFKRDSVKLCKGVTPIWTSNSFKVLMSESICLASCSAFILLKFCSLNRLPSLFGASAESIEQSPWKDDFQSFSCIDESSKVDYSFRKVKRISKPLSSSFIFEVESLDAKRRHYALKTPGIYSPYTDKKEWPENRIRKEIEIMKDLKKFNLSYSAQMICSGIDSFLKKPLFVIKPFGKSVLSLRKSSWRSMIVRLAHNISEALNSLHCKGWIHNDISPTNIIIAGNSFYLIDFESATLTGTNLVDRYTVEFCSSRRILGYPPSFADDWESLIYTIYYLENQFLPWIGPTQILFSCWYDSYARIKLLNELDKRRPIWISKCPLLSSRISALAKQEHYPYQLKNMSEEKEERKSDIVNELI